MKVLVKRRLRSRYVIETLTSASNELNARRFLICTQHDQLQLCQNIRPCLLLAK